MSKVSSSLHSVCHCSTFFSPAHSHALLPCMDLDHLIAFCRSFAHPGASASVAVFLGYVPPPTDPFKMFPLDRPGHHSVPSHSSTSPSLSPSLTKTLFGLRSATPPARSSWMPHESRPSHSLLPPPSSYPPFPLSPPPPLQAPLRRALPASSSSRSFTTTPARSRQWRWRPA